MSIDARAFVDSLHTLEAGIRNAAVTAVRQAVDETKRHARSTTLFKDGPQGNLRKSIDGSAFGLEGEVHAGGEQATYARYVESGTPPHEIAAKGGGVLRFVQNGEVRFARKVQHPGTAERPFMAQAAAHGEQVLDYGLEYFADHAIQTSNAQGA